jgi:riboflavin kinase/FMN adenylyltransferase
MEIVRSHTAVPASARGAAVALGNFDGVHPGHRSVIAGAVEKARDLDVPSAVMTFDPHPRRFFQADADPFELTPGETKARHIAALGVDVLFLIPFDRSFAEISAEEFVDDVLAEALGVRHVVAGYNFVFGRGRGGDIGMLREAGDRNGFGVSVVSAVGGGDGAVFSSTAIRDRLRAGNVCQAATLLGRPWEVEGVVMSGDQRGRQIGFPTANVDPGDYLMPLLGVYAVWVGIVDGEKTDWRRGVVNVGRRPTFDGESVTVEVNLFDFEGDLYGRTLRVAFADFIRPEMKFDGIDAIRAQIAADCDAARFALEGIVAGAANALPDAAAVDAA